MSGIEDWTHEEIASGGVKLHCVTRGEGDLVILLHGFPECWFSWRHQIPFLAGRFKVVAPDMRGYNLSEKPPDVSSYRMPFLLDDVRGIIDHYGYEKAHLVAHDWGGAVAWSFAMTHPDRLDRLVVMNCPHPGVFMENLRDNPRQMLRSWYMLFFQLPRLPELLLSAFDYYGVGRVFTGWAVDKEAFSAEEVRALKKAASEPGALTGGINYYRALFRDRALFKESSGFPPVKCPTLLIWAEQDRALGKELTFRLEKYFLTYPQVRYVPGCSHWVQQEQPFIVNDMLGEFLARSGDS